MGGRCLLTAAVHRDVRRIGVLHADDVIARIDVQDLELVVNYDLPRDAEDYAGLAWEFRERARQSGLPAKVDEEGVVRVRSAADSISIS